MKYPTILILLSLAVTLKSCEGLDLNLLKKESFENWVVVKCNYNCNLNTLPNYYLSFGSKGTFAMRDVENKSRLEGSYSRNSADGMITVEKDKGTWRGLNDGFYGDIQPWIKLANDTIEIYYISGPVPIKVAAYYSKYDE